MKKFKEGQIVKAKINAAYISVGEIAEVKKKEGFEGLYLVFNEGTSEESAFACDQAIPDDFDFYEKVDNWCNGCNPGNCMGCHIPSNDTKATPQQKVAPSVDAEDAARYRWLRSQACMGYPSSEGSDHKDAYMVVTGYGYERSDAIVDAAIGATRSAQNEGDTP